MEKNVTHLPYGEIKKCDFCVGGVSRAAIAEQQFPYGEGDEQVVLSAKVPVWICEQCGEQYTDEGAEIARHDAICRHLGRLTPTDMRRLRERRSMSQQSWADLTGIGVASVKRWENGTQIQGEAMDNYLRLLDREEVFSALRTQSSSRLGTPVFRTNIPAAASLASLSFNLRPERSSTG